MSRLDRLIHAYPLPDWRRAGWLVALMVAAAGTWGYFAELDEVAVAPGKVVPQGQIRVVQHLEGGILRELHVHEGQAVTAGDALALLDLGVTGVNPDELAVQIDGLVLRRSRLAAESRNRTPSFPPEVAARHPELVRSEREAYSSRRRQLESALAVLGKQVRQRELEIDELVARRESLAAKLKLARERLAMSKGLLERSLVSKLDHLALESEVRSLEGQLNELEPAIPRINAARAETLERMRDARLKFRRAAAEELGRTELALARNRKLLTKAADRERRTLVRSPIDGVVKNMRYHTIGGVIRPGDPIMEIVPSDETLVIEARLDPVDIGYIAVGQRAVVKVSAYDFIRYGALEGRVQNFVPDASIDGTGARFFKVVIKTEKSFLGDRPDHLRIIPGMQATVDIHTGERTVLDYLITPVLKLRHEAFRER